MSKPKPAKSNPGADAIVNAIQESSRVAKEGTEQVARDLKDATKDISRSIADHILHDATRFADLNLTLSTVSKDVTSLVTTRTFTYGVWKTLTVIGAVAAAVGGLLAFVVPRLTQ